MDEAGSSSGSKRLKVDGSSRANTESGMEILIDSEMESHAEASEDAAAATVGDLCDELLQQIFSLFPAQDVFGILSKVCVRWERIAKDPSTLNQTQLILEDKGNEFFSEVLTHAACIGEVYILPSYPPSAMNQLIQGPRVRKLVIVGDSDTHQLWPSPADLISLLHHNMLTLQHLSMQVDSKLIHFHKSAGSFSPSFQSLIAGMKKLKYLHLTGECWRDWDEWDLSQEHPPLHTLKIDSISFVSDECPFIRDLIMLCKPTLRVLYLPCQNPDDALSLLNAGAFEGSFIEELMVCTGCLRVISQMRHLKILAVADNGKEDQDQDLSWLKTLPILNAVWKLTLQSLTETGNERCGFVWYLLSKFNQVKEFWGLECSVEEETFNMFLRNNTLLQELHFLDFVGFDNPNQVTLLQNYLSNLRLLDLALSNVTEEMNTALKSIGEARPNLKIVFDDDYEETEMLGAHINNLFDVNPS